MSDKLLSIWNAASRSMSTTPKGLGNLAGEAVSLAPPSLLTANSTTTLPQATTPNATFADNGDVIFSDNTFASTNSIPTAATSLDGPLPPGASFDASNKELPKDVTQEPNINKRFIPIVLETEFAFSTSSNKKSKIYIVFDSTPDTITFQRSASYQQIAFPGRSEPVQIYANTAPQTFQLTGKFFASNANDHLGKLRISEQLLSLTLPSKHNFVPTPVKITIGEWKKAIRCIVNSVTIKHMGPWTVATQPSSSAFVKGAGSASIPTHAPRYFEADMSFTIISEANRVSYVEDIMVGNNLAKLAVDPAITRAINQSSSTMSTEQRQGQFAHLVQEQDAAAISIKPTPQTFVDTLFIPPATGVISNK